LDRKPFHHFYFKSGSGLEQANIVRAIYQDHLHLYLGTRDYGLLKLDKQGRVLAHYRHDPKNNESLASNDVRKIYRDSKQRLWIAARGGISILNEKNGSFQTVLRGSIDNIPTYVFNILEDANGNIWFATLSGLKKYNETTEGVDDVGKTQGVITHPGLRVIINDNDDNLWIGSEIGGLTCLKRKTQSTKEAVIFESFSYKNDAYNPNSLSDNRVYSACEDENGSLWFGTGAGLNRYNPKTNEFDVVRKSNGLSNDMIVGVLPDLQGHVWVSHKRGLSRVGIHDLSIINFDLSDGLQNTEFNEDAYFRNAQTGELFFGGPKGFNHFYPEKITTTSSPMNVLITNLSVNGEVVQIGDSINQRVILDKNIVLAERIVLTRHEASFAIDFNGFDYSSPDNIQYVYLLEGFDKKWNHTDSRLRRAFYTNLPPKTYVFKVKARHHDGTWPDTVTTLTIVVEPPFWQTIWFQIGAIALLISTVGSIIYYRMNRLKRQNLMLESKVDERTRDLKESNKKIQWQLDQIGLQNTIILSKNEEIVAQSEMLATQKANIENAYEELDLYRNRLEKLVDERTNELQKAKEKAEESDRLKTSFLSNLSHEVRTPLNAIIGFSSFLVDDNFNKREKKDFKAVIDINCNSLLYLIEDIVIFSKIEASDIEMQMARIPLSNIMLQLPAVYAHEMSRQQYGQSDKSKIEFRINNSVDETISLFTDETRVAQLFSYLLNNAIKYTSSGFIEAGCYLHNDEKVCFYVKDTGIGISEEDQTYIFKRFRKVEAFNADVYRGVGLGLSITQQLVNLLGGTLSVKSEVGQGSTFSFVLPLKGARAMPYSHHEEQQSNDIPNLSNHAILIAEDDVGHYLHLQKLLNKTGALIVHAFNGKQLIDIYTQNPNVSLVLIDIKMPEMDGWEAMSHLKAQHISVPVIALTSFTFDHELEKMYEAGFAEVIAKPITPKTLYALLKRTVAY
jgi:signal transduction histidine kinase/CheY-like chemotaxis protein